MTPDSTPSYLNDLIASLLQFVDQTDIRTQTGNNGPFNYRLVPYIGNSDHASLPRRGDRGHAVQSLARQLLSFERGPRGVCRSDRDEARRLHGRRGVYYLANAGPCRGARPGLGSGRQRREVDRARWRARACGCWTPTRPPFTSGTAPRKSKVTAAFNRAKGGVESVLRLSSDASVSGSRQAAGRRAWKARGICRRARSRRRIRNAVRRSGSSRRRCR